MGIASTIFYGYNNAITLKEASQISFLTLGIYTAGLILFAMEGLICILMMAPLGIALTWIGSLIGFVIVDRKPGSSSTVILILIGSIPTLAFFENKGTPPLSVVTTFLEIKAPRERVWKNLIAFPQLAEPSELIFKAGIAYPINAKIEGPELELSDTAILQPVVLLSL